MNYPIVIHKDRRSDFGVTVPDLPGCFSAGRTLDEAVALAREAVELHVEGLIEEGQPVPDPRPLDAHAGNPDYAGGTWAIVPVDLSKLPLKVRRINITVPERLLAALDRYARDAGETRSGLLAKAAAVYVSKGTAGAVKSPGSRSAGHISAGCGALLRPKSALKTRNRLDRLTLPRFPSHQGHPEPQKNERQGPKDAKGRNART